MFVYFIKCARFTRAMLFCCIFPQGNWEICRLSLHLGYRLTVLLILIQCGYHIYSFAMCSCWQLHYYDAYVPFVNFIFFYVKGLFLFYNLHCFKWSTMHNYQWACWKVWLWGGGAFCWPWCGICISFWTTYISPS